MNNSSFFQVVIPTRRPDGTVALNIINPDQKPSMTVGALAGPLKIGTDRLPTFHAQPKMDATVGKYLLSQPSGLGQQHRDEANSAGKFKRDLHGVGGSSWAIFF